MQRLEDTATLIRETLPQNFPNKGNHMIEPRNIPFICACFEGNELAYIVESVQSGHISGDGSFTKKCHRSFEERLGVKKTLLTTSCTDALEMCAILCVAICLQGQ